MMRYIDSHAHIMSEEFAGDLEEMLRKTEEAHVDRIMIITLEPEEAYRALEFRKRDPEKYQVAHAVFPEDADKLTEERWDAFREITARDDVCAVGECGLEYHWVKDENLRAKQRELFVRQIEWANEIGKPVLVHSRDAMQDTFDIMKQHRCRGLLHCFPGSKEMALEFTKLGYYIALGGAVTFKNARHSGEVCRTIDEKYLLTETDSPYMSPEPLRGRRNDPSNIPYVLRKMAEIRNVPEEYLAGVIFDNYQRFLEGK